MLFPTATFAIFFLIVLPLSWLLMPRGERWRPFILVASFVFYGAWDWRFVLLLAASIVWNQLFALAIHQREARPGAQDALTVAVAGNLAALAYFKYAPSSSTSTNNLFALVGIDVPLEARSVVLPVGISFFTFMAISYVVDVYRRRLPAASLSNSPRTSRSSRISSPGRSSGRATSSRSSSRRATRATSTPPGRSS